MKCPNTACGGYVEEHVKDTGAGSRYCVDGCGYYEEFKTAPPKKRPKPQQPQRRRK